MARRKSLLLVLAVGAALAAGPAYSDAQKAETYLQNAREKLAKGDLNGAISLFKSAVIEDPNNAGARFELGRVELRQDDLLSAEKELRAAKDLNYSDEALSVEFARLYLRQRKYDRVIAEIEPDDRPAEDEATVRLARGIAYTNLGKYAAAEDSLKEAIQRTSKPARAIVAMARLREAQGDYDGAIATVKQAIDADPKNELAWLDKGQIHAAHGDNAAAREAYDRAIELQPSFEDARIARAQLFLDMGEQKLAKADIDALLKRRSAGAWPNYLNAQLLVQQNKFREAQAALEKSRLNVNNSPRALKLLVTINLGAQQPAQAEANVNRYLGLRPDDPWAVETLYTLLARRGDYQRAVEVLKPASEKHPDDLDLLAKLGEAYAGNNQPDKAAPVFEKLARAYSDKKDDAGALAAAEKAYGMAHSPSSADTFGWILVQKGDTARALPMLEKAAADSPKTPQIRYHYAVGLMKAGRTADAKRELEAVLKAEPPITEVDDAKQRLKELGGG